MRKLPAAVQKAMAKAGVKPKRNKLGNTPEVYRGVRFQSKAEAEYYRRLIQEKICNEITWFIRQTPFHLPGNVKYLADFLVVNTDGSIRVVDVKGHDTDMSRLKRKQVQELYGIKVHVLKAVYRRGVIVDFEEVEQ